LISSPQNRTEPANGDTATLDQIDKKTRSSNEKIATTLDLSELRSNVSTTLNDTWANPESVQKSHPMPLQSAHIDMGTSALAFVIAVIVFV
jgi:hypothetical protein